MDVKQQIVADRVDTLGSALELEDDEAFMRFIHSLVTHQSIHAFDPSDVVDGGQDKQMDIVTIDSDEADKATVYVIQTKFSQSFSSNALVQLGNGLDWLLNQPRSKVQEIANKALVDKIIEYRSLQHDVGPSNIRMIVVFATNGDESRISEEFSQERDKLIERYDNDVFEESDLIVMGCNEINSWARAQEKNTRKIDADIQIKYDANNPSLIKYYAEELKGVVCTVPAREIARIVNDDESGSIFDLNIRRFLGKSRAVNKEIKETSTDPKISHEFWFLNNGITIVCDSFDAITDVDDPKIKLRNMQIVNGCQTATTLAKASKDGELQRSARVLVRIYQTPDTQLVDKIVLTTNNQNKVSSRDLRSNDEVQVDLENGFEIYDLRYERKPGQFAGTGVDPKAIYPNEEVGQSYCAITLRNPADARGRKYKIWGDLYSRVFDTGNGVERHVMSALLARNASSWCRKVGLHRSDEELVRVLAKKGIYHIARVAAYKVFGCELKDVDQDEISAKIEECQKDETLPEGVMQEAFEDVRAVVAEQEQYHGDVDRALKSYGINDAISKALHT